MTRCVEKADLIKLYQQAVAKRVQVMHDKRNAAAAAPGKPRDWSLNPLCEQKRGWAGEGVGTRT